MDQMVYGFGALRIDWQVKKAFRSHKINNSFQGMFQQILDAESIAPQTRELKTIFEGNEIATIDPFSFFPDPRVPMTELSREGEFVFGGRKSQT